MVCTRINEFGSSRLTMRLIYTSDLPFHLVYLNTHLLNKLVNIRSSLIYNSFSYPAAPAPAKPPQQTQSPNHPNTIIYSTHTLTGMTSTPCFPPNRIPEILLDKLTAMLSNYHQRGITRLIISGTDTVIWDLMVLRKMWRVVAELL